jgi:hypothetical protein
MTPVTTIRGAVADGADGERINRLAALADSRAPEGMVLLAEVEGDPVAAIGIFDGHAISDPGRATLALRMRLHLLRLQLRVIVAIHGI